MTISFDVRLSRARMLSPSVRELAFARLDGEPMVFEAGQGVSLVVPLEGAEVPRAYSIASPPDGSPGFAIAVKENGPASVRLHALPEGTVLRAMGPSGVLTRRAGVPSLFVGTGTGITALRSMILDAVSRGERAPLVLLGGTRHESERLYAAELADLAAAHSNVHAHYSLSKPSDAWTGLTGWVQEHVVRIFRELEAHGPPHVYLCGSRAMTTAVRELLLSIDVPEDRVNQ